MKSAKRQKRKEPTKQIMSIVQVALNDFTFYLIHQPDSEQFGDVIMETTQAAVKDYILSEFLPGENPEALTEATPLITGGILDSLSTLKLVSFLEDKFGIQIEAHEADVEHLNSIATIAALVQAKQA